MQMLSKLLLQVVDKSRYATGDNSLQREIQVLCKVRAAVLGSRSVLTCLAMRSGFKL